MMHKQLVLSLPLSLAVMACQTKATEAPTVAAAHQAAPASRPDSQPSSRPKETSAEDQRQANWAEGPVHRGGPFTLESETQLANVLQRPDEFAGKTVRLSGQVTRACSKKGCWMELREDPEQAGVRITFQDYGFFVPLDSAGASAVVEGTVKVETLSADHVAHLKGEGAQIVSDEKGEAKEIGLVATAVRLEKKPSPSPAAQ